MKVIWMFIFVLYIIMLISLSVIFIPFAFLVSLFRNYEIEVYE
jgi:hypothetical protein